MGRPKKIKVACSACQGRGWTNEKRPGKLPVSIICKTCKGKGWIMYAPKTK